MTAALCFLPTAESAYRVAIAITAAQVEATGRGTEACIEPFRVRPTSPVATKPVIAKKDQLNACLNDLRESDVLRSAAYGLLQIAAMLHTLKPLPWS